MPPRNAHAPVPARKAAAFFLLWGAAAMASAEQNWFTVIGDANDPNADTVMVDPVPTNIDGQRRTMNVKVSRSKTRTSPRGVVYRSYVGKVMFDCGEKSAFFISADLYVAPLWKGAVSQSNVYDPKNAPRMSFREIQPNPAPRIIRAACSF